MRKKYTSDDIQTLSGREHVRLRPKLYFEKCFTEKSLDSLPFEVLCHAFDEYFVGNCNEIKLRVFKDSFSVKYNVGMPLRRIENNDLSYAEMIMTKLMACSNLKKHLAVGQEFCSLGMATINFASDTCQLTTVGKKNKGTFVFKNGETVTRTIEPYESEDAWTEIFVRPSKEIFDNLPFTPNGIEKKAREISNRLTGLTISIEK